jgi:hypothetical protein
LEKALSKEATNPPSAPVLGYESQPSKSQVWKRRVFSASTIAVAHVLAMIMTAVMVAIMPLLGSAALYIAVAASEAKQGREVPSPNGIHWVFAAFGAVSIISGLVLVLMCILTDLVRRLLRQGWWRTLGIVSSLLLVGVSIWMALLATPLSAKFMAGGAIWLLLEGLFCGYWVPMGCVEYLIRRIFTSPILESRKGRDSNPTAA